MLLKPRVKHGWLMLLSLVSIDVRTVGAGGGSIAYVPELTKALRVGPQSAGRSLVLRLTGRAELNPQSQTPM
ncbi:MAG: hypothetical protein Ct9H300mP14_02680 [Gammaproteobacteria bacterium]|nr:MAG: hypothetical protein Ct9H300mP14_02680 [Gammaproteobacteria bacterium]